MAKRVKALVPFRVGGQHVAEGDIVLVDESDYYILAGSRKGASYYVEDAPETDRQQRKKRKKATHDKRELATND